MRKMRTSMRVWRVLAMLAAMVVAWLEGRAASHGIQFFRSQHGVASTMVKGLPFDLNDTRNLRWRSDSPPGHSTPLVMGNQIVVTGFDMSRRRLVVNSFDRQTGGKRWEWEVPEVPLETVHHTTGGVAQPSPATDGERVFVLFGSYGLVALDAGGRLLWERRMGPFQDEYGAGSSPVIAGGMVVVQQDHDTDSFLAAYDRKTGHERWRTSRPDAVRSYSTPVIWERGGKPELLVAGALELAGYDLKTGEKQWWTLGLARIVIPVPVPSQDRIYMASWAPGGDAGRRIALEDWTAAVGKWDRDGDGRLARGEIGNPEVLDRFFRMDLDQNGWLERKEWERHAAVFQSARNALLALRPSVSRGELPASDLLWSHPRGVPYVASPLVDQGVLWMVKDGGIVTQIEAAGGTMLREERLPGMGAYYASPVAADGKVYFSSEQGVVTVMANEPGWRLLGSRDFKEKIYATPVASESGLLIRTVRALYSFKAAVN
ncbi:MAG: hypothetical protein FJ404_00125 [Verrucomicrobia bacterium]|nr:hypothetical protein [Verrucomicrobiota bacterium]